jgi:Phage virion morphogenesis family
VPASLRQRWASLGSFQGDLIIEVIPDPDELANAYLRVAEELDDTRAPLQASKIVAREDMQAHFDTETAPDGSRWEILSEVTEDEKMRKNYPLDVLRRSGLMEDLATSESNWRVLGDTLWFDTSGLPTRKGRPYWYFHQEGASSSIEYDIGGETVTFDWDLPARPFIGLSEDAQLRVIEIFDAWFDDSIMTFEHPSGRIQTMKPGGGFGPMV